MNYELVKPNPNKSTQYIKNTETGEYLFKMESPASIRLNKHQLRRLRKEDVNVEEYIEDQAAEMAGRAGDGMYHWVSDSVKLEYFGLA